MIRILGFAFLIAAAATYTAACRMKGYAQGKVEGEKIGYQKGFTAASKIVESLNDWWGTVDRQIEQAQQKIRDEERWP